MKSKLEKADLLEMANAYILHLQSSSVFSSPGSVSSYSLGFNECAAEVAKYIDSNEGNVRGEGDTGIHGRLLEHLTSFAASKDVVEKCARDRARARASAVDAAEKSETDGPQSVPEGANSATLAGDNETVGETSQRSGSGESGLVLETSETSEDSKEQSTLFCHFNDSESKSGMANNSDFVSNGSDSLKRQKYVIPRKPERSVTIKADMVNSDKQDGRTSTPKDDHVATSNQKALADTTHAPPQARVPTKEFGHVTSQIRIPLVNTNHVTHDEDKTCRGTKCPQRTPLSNAGNMMTSHLGFPINKQPIRKRLAAQYQNGPNAKTDGSNNICVTLKQLERERQIDMANVEKENGYEVRQVSEIYINSKENDNKLERMVELTTKVLTQNCPRNFPENKSKEVYIQPVKEGEAGQRNVLPEDVSYGYSIFRPDLRTGGSSEDVWRPW